MTRPRVLHKDLELHCEQSKCQRTVQPTGLIPASFLWKANRKLVLEYLREEAFTTWKHRFRRDPTPTWWPCHARAVLGWRMAPRYRDRWKDRRAIF